MFLLTILLATSSLCAGSITNTGQENCKPCSPQGATSLTPPTVGPELKSLYIDILQTVKDISFHEPSKDTLVPREASFCCLENLDCVNVLNLNIPMCYDKFTTNYAFPDGSWGSLTTGEYHGQDGGKANLVIGDFTNADGEKGDIYAEDPGAKPNTATLKIPPQWTGTGVGSAVPPTEIATVITDTPTQTTGNPTAATSSPGQTTGNRTAVASSPAQTTGNPRVTSASSTGAALHVEVDPNIFGISIFGALMYAVYTL